MLSRKAETVMLAYVNHILPLLESAFLKTQTLSGAGEDCFRGLYFRG